MVTLNRRYFKIVRCILILHTLLINTVFGILPQGLCNRMICSDKCKPIDKCRFVEGIVKSLQCIHNNTEEHHNSTTGKPKFKKEKQGSTTNRIDKQQRQMTTSCENLHDTTEKTNMRNCKPAYTKDHGYMWVGKGKNKMYLKRHDNRTTWVKALDVCRSEDATLLMPDTKEKMKTLERRVLQLNDALKRIYMWIGLSYYGKNEFKWTDGRPVTFTDWLQGQPDSYTKESARNEDCVTLVYHLIKGLHWCDMRCAEHNGFICEKK